MKPPVENPALRSWVSLNDAIRKADEDRCNDLLQEELAGRRRRQFIMRIHSRINKVRADRERLELADKASK